MDYFTTFRSNTLAGSGNQCFFYNNPQTAMRCCCLYRIFEGGSFPYSFLFSNIVDSTFSDGSFSHSNLVIDSWNIEEMSVGVTSFCDEFSFAPPVCMKPVLFSGKKNKIINPGEIFYTDPIVLNAAAGQYLCLEILFSGRMIPNHEESIIPSFILQDGKWVSSKRHPYPSMIGAEIPVKKSIAFLGDSITQGIGTPVNSYTHWNAVFAEKLGHGYSYWNLGLGYGRASDAASDGVWLYKAKRNDIVFVCYGVNDILQGGTSEEIKKHIQNIVGKLSQAKTLVIVQTVPPFDYPPICRQTWSEVNRFIMNDLKDAAFVFDCVPYLQLNEEEPYRAKYGSHPNSEGCRIWGEALFNAVTMSGLI